MYRWCGLVIQALLLAVVVQVAPQVTYDVTCSATMMKVVMILGNNQSNVFVENLRGFSGCLPKKTGGKTVLNLPLDNFHKCGTTRMTDKLSGHTLYYNRIIIDQEKKPREVLLVKCVLPGDKTKPADFERRRHKRDVRDELPPGFVEAEDLNITNVVAHAPTPYLNLAVRQNGRMLDTNLNVQPGTPLEMVIYLDSKSASVYGILVSYLKVTDGSPKHDEVIVMNGCSIDPYIFGNFETPDDGKTLYSKFRAFKFPDSNYVLFVGTVNVCLKQCRGVQCGSNQIGYGRKKREIPAEMPFDPNKLYEVEMTTVLQINFAPEHFEPNRGSVVGAYAGDLQTAKPRIYRQRSSANSICSSNIFALILSSLMLIVAIIH